MLELDVGTNNAAGVLRRAGKGVSCRRGGLAVTAAGCGALQVNASWVWLGAYHWVRV